MLRYFFLSVAVLGFSSILYIVFQPRTQNYIRKQIRNTASSVSFQGKNAQGKTFHIKAQKAFLGENKTMYFKDASFVLHDKNFLRTTASNGFYDMKEKKIYLNGLVKAHYGKNCSLVTKAAKINYNDSTLETLKPVHAYIAPDIHVYSNKLYATSNHHMIFSQKVKIHLNLTVPSKKKN